jgi:hypothetical protein
MIFADAATGGYIAGNIAIIVLSLIAVVVIGLALRHGPGEYNDGGGYVLAGITALVWVIALGLWFWSTWPFAYDYHHWVDKRVHVTDTSSRLLTDSDGNIGQKFVVRDSTGTYYGINDTRGALVKEGDVVQLRCKKSYDYGVPRSSHGWDCKWNGRTA